MIGTVLFSAVFQVMLLTLIPFLAYIFIHKTTKDFLSWIGFSKAPSKAYLYAGILGALSYAIMSTLQFWMIEQGYSDGNLNTTSPYQSFVETGWSIQTAIVLLLWACIQTSLSEEIFFRGFIAKRLVDKLGFALGNSIQAIIFGAIHVPGVFSHGLLPSLLVFISTGTIGFTLGHLMHKKADHSIIPGWVAHASLNVLSFVVSSLWLL